LIEVGLEIEGGLSMKQFMKGEGTGLMKQKEEEDKDEV
jgi:hypothetical protein